MDPSSTDGNVRKRVCKACDRCRLKKSKCDGASPCSRCKADNAICVFGERKKAHDKVYPKGYVEMLEQQQSQLVAGLRELYRRLQTGEGWPGAPLREGQGGHPLTHDILDRLDLLHGTTEGGTHYDGFEEDCQKMQRKLLENGSGFHHRRGSVSSDSEHGHLSSPSSYGTPSSARLSIDSSRNVTPPTPPMNSPFPGQAQLNTSASLKSSTPLAIPPYMRAGITPAQWIQSPFGTDVPMMDDLPSLAFSTDFDAQMSYDQSALSFEHQLSAQPATMNPSMAMTDWTDPSELDFSNFIDPIST